MYTNLDTDEVNHNRILEKRVVDQIQKSADQILNMQLG